MDKQINSLKPGQSLTLGSRTWVERSGDGKLLRFCRQDGNTVTVFKTCEF